MQLPQKLETERLILRPHQMSDFEGFFTFLSNPEATKYLSFSSEERTREGSKAFFTEILATYDTNRPIFGLAIEEKQTGHYAGFCGLASLPRKAATEVYYVLLPGFRQKGYGAEMAIALFEYAFKSLQIEHLICFVNPENHSGLQFLERIGMKNEGMVDHEAYPHPVLQYGIYAEHSKV